MSEKMKIEFVEAIIESILFFSILTNNKLMIDFNLFVYYYYFLFSILVYIYIFKDLHIFFIC